jgi:hypothetical protein
VRPNPEKSTVATEISAASQVIRNDHLISILSPFWGRDFVTPGTDAVKLSLNTYAGAVAHDTARHYRTLSATIVLVSAYSNGNWKNATRDFPAKRYRFFLKSRPSMRQRLRHLGLPDGNIETS